MNKLLVAILTLMLMTSVAGCGTTSSTNSTANSSKTYHFVFVPKLVHPWYQDVISGADAAVAQLKKEGINVTYSWNAPPKADPSLHVQYLEQALQTDPDVLAVSVLDSAVDDPIIKQAIASGHKVITFDSGGPSDGGITFVGHAENTQDGAKLADLLATKMNNHGEVAMLVGSLTAPNHEQRVQGFEEELKKYPDIKIVAKYPDNDDEQTAVSYTQEILQAHPNVGAIFAVDASAPVGAAQVLKTAGKLGKVAVVGFDDLPPMIPYIQNGSVTGTVVQNVFDIGYYSVMEMVNIAQGKTVPDYVPTGAFVATKDNLDTEYNQKKGHLVTIPGISIP